MGASRDVYIVRSLPSRMELPAAHVDWFRATNGTRLDWLPLVRNFGSAMESLGRVARARASEGWSRCKYSTGRYIFAGRGAIELEWWESWHFVDGFVRHFCVLMTQGHKNFVGVDKNLTTCSVLIPGRSIRIWSRNSPSTSPFSPSLARHRFPLAYGFRKI